jgi:hypothetical protein
MNADALMVSSFHGNGSTASSRLVGAGQGKTIQSLLLLLLLLFVVVIDHGR